MPKIKLKKAFSGRKKRRPLRKKKCYFCGSPTTEIDYKDATLLKQYVTEHGKIVPRRFTGSCARHQSRLTRAIKRARQIALLSFAGE
jgi:small subunit ribosomal protein S18